MYREKGTRPLFDACGKYNIGSIASPLAFEIRDHIMINWQGSERDLGSDRTLQVIYAKREGVSLSPPLVDLYLYRLKSSESVNMPASSQALVSSSSAYAS